MTARPVQVKGATTKVRVGCGKIYITQSDPDEPYKEILLKLGKSGGCAASFLDGLGRLITHCLNAGIPDETIIKSLIGINCPSPGLEGSSCCDAVGKFLRGEEPEE